MSDIGKFSSGGRGAGAFSGNAFDMPSRNFARRDEKSVNFGNSGVSTGETGEQPVNSDVLTAFERSIRTAARTLGEKHDEKAADPVADARLLAESQAIAAVSSLPSFADIAPAPQAPLAPAGSELVAVVTHHIEEAIRADMRPSKDAPLVLHLNFPEAHAGLTGLTMAVTPTTLDVVLQRAAGDLTPDLLAATAALADRLRLRFGKRSVRILDRVTPASDQTQSGLPDLSAAAGDDA